MGGDNIGGGKLNKLDQTVRKQKPVTMLNDVLERTGLYESSSSLKEQATAKKNEEQAQITAQAEAQALRDAETRQRMNIFKTAGGSEGEEVGSTKKRRIFGN